jgi:hypothetical protein
MGAGHQGIPYQIEVKFELTMVAAMSAGKPSAIATKAKAEATIMTISPFCLAENPAAATTGTMSRPGFDRCDGHHEMVDCDVERFNDS